MKSSYFIPIAFFVGIAVGVLYGWRSGYKDGAVSSSLPFKSYLKSFGALRGSDDTANRDRLVDLQAIDAANVLANSKSYSPLFYVLRPKSEKGLLHIAAYWELNYEQPSVWRKGFYPSLFDVESGAEEYLNELKTRRADEYQAILKEHRQSRDQKEASGDSK